MSGSLQQPTTFLKKKSSRKVRLAPRYNKELDLTQIKENFFDELFYKSKKSLEDESCYENKKSTNDIYLGRDKTQYDFRKIIEFLYANKDDLKINNKSSKLSEYEKKYKNFIQEELSFNHFNLINRIIQDSKNLTDEMKIQFPLHKILYKIIKSMMMTELEIVYFSLFIERYGWGIEDIQDYNKKLQEENINFHAQDISFEENLLFIAIFVKNFVNDNIEFMTDFLKNEIPELMQKLNYWSSIKLLEQNVFQITHISLNLKYRELNRSYNTFCKSNYIDYNCLVDQIIQMSQAYANNEKQAESEIYNKSKAELELENLIKTKNLKNVSIFKTNSIIRKPEQSTINEKNDKINPSTHNHGQYILESTLNKRFIHSDPNQSNKLLGLEAKCDNYNQIYMDMKIESNERTQEIIKNPFEDASKFVSVLDLNSFILKNPFESSTQVHVESNIENIINHPQMEDRNNTTNMMQNTEIKKEEYNSQIPNRKAFSNLRLNQKNQNIIESLKTNFILPETQERHHGNLIKTDSLQNNISSPIPNKILSMDVLNNSHSKSIMSKEFQDRYLSKKSGEIGLNFSKISDSTHLLKDNFSNFCLNNNFQSSYFELEKGKENYLAEDTFKNYSSFFHQNSYFLPKYDVDLTPNKSIFDLEKLNANHAFKLTPSNSNFLFLGRGSFGSSLQSRNEISFELRNKLYNPDALSNIFNSKQSFSLINRQSDDTQTDKSAQITLSISDNI